MNMKALEAEAKDREVARYRLEIEEKQEDVENQRKDMLKMKDDRLDFEARVDQTFVRERSLQEEVVQLREKLGGKDQALAALSQSLMQKALAHQQMSEKYNQFKNKLMQENCFHVNFLATHLAKNLLVEQATEVTIGFIRDKSFEEEFFMVIECKEFNTKTCQKDRQLVAVEDVLEIEHTDGLRFQIHYVAGRGSGKSVSGFGQPNGANKVAGAIGGLLSKIKKKDANNGKAGKAEDPDGELAKQQRTDVFESKHVKEIIETFNNVMALIDQYQVELAHFVEEESSGSGEEEDGTEPRAPKVYKAVLNKRQDVPKMAPTEPEPKTPETSAGTSAGHTGESQQADEPKKPAMLALPKEAAVDPTMFSQEESLIYEKIKRQQVLDGQLSDEDSRAEAAATANAAKTGSHAFRAKKKLEELKLGQIFKSNKRKQKDEIQPAK